MRNVEIKLLPRGLLRLPVDVLLSRHVVKLECGFSWCKKKLYIYNNNNNNNDFDTQRLENEKKKKIIMRTSIFMQPYAFNIL